MRRTHDVSLRVRLFSGIAKGFRKRTRTSLIMSRPWSLRTSSSAVFKLSFSSLAWPSRQVETCQVVNILSFMERVDSQKHIDFSLTSTFGGGHPGGVKRKNQKIAIKKVWRWK